MNYKLLNNVTGWVVFALSWFVFLSTMAPTASFWDCGEFIACSNELEVPHPPGAPFFLMLGRIFAMFAGGNVEKIAFWVNILSTLASAFTVLFTFWVTTILAKKLIFWNSETKNESELSTPQTIVILAAGAVSAFACAFADSFWFNAVEAEVYAMSSFFTAIVIWAIFKWEAVADEPRSERWLILIAYLMGLSIGVHLLNLLTIPALGLVYYFRKYKFSWTGFFAALGIGVVILGVIQTGLIIYTFDLAWSFEKLFVGTLSKSGSSLGGFGLPFGSGLVFTLALIIGALAWGIRYSIKTNNKWLNLSLLATVVIYIGISSYAMIPIRSKANAPIDENDPENVLTFLSYMKREQYGQRPLMKGPLFNARPINQTETGTEYILEKGKDGYTEYGKKYDYEYDPKDEKVLPRMWSRDHYDAGPHGYVHYVTNKGSDKRNPMDDKPSGGDDIRFMWGYQFIHMYYRYFMWNFAGRENDEQDSAWETGLGGKDMPDHLRNHASRNKYFAIPLLFALLGIYWQVRKDPKNATVIGLLFFFTGIAILIYLNQYPMQPRERDYSYAGSFQTFAIWVGLGVIALYEFSRKFMGESSAYVAAALGLIAPGLMLAENYKDHSRAGNYMCPDSAYNLLNSLAPNAVVFTNGDNDTFPLWYAQEVEGIRPDVRVLCLSYVNTDWYIRHMKLKMNESEPLPITMSDKEITGSENQYKDYGKDTLVSNLPTNVEQLIADKIITAEEAKYVQAPFVWKAPTRKQGGMKMLMLSDILVRNLVENVAKQGWKRPIYFANTVAPSSFIGLEPYFRQEGLAYRILPLKKPEFETDPYDPFDGTIRTDLMEEALLKKFKFRGLDDANVYYDDNSRRMLGNYYNTYIRLSSQYLNKAELAKRDSAKVDQATIDGYTAKAKEVMAAMEKNFSYKIAMPETYLLVRTGMMFDRLGMKEKSEEYLNLGRKMAEENLNYYLGKKRYYGSADVDTYALQLLRQHFYIKKQNDKVQEITGVLNNLAEKTRGWSYEDRLWYKGLSQQ